MVSLSTFGTMAFTTLLSVGLTEAAATVLNIEQIMISVQGKEYERLAFRGDGPQWKAENGQGYVRVEKGDVLDLTYVNNLKGPAIIHAHGQQPPLVQDGVPDVSRPPIPAGEQFSINYPPLPGSYFLHSHWGFQHELGLSAPLIVDEAPPSDYPEDIRKALDNAQEVVVHMEDFCPFNDAENPSCADAEAIFQVLVDSWAEDAPNFNFTNCMDAGTSMDVTYRHHLINGKTFNDPINVHVRRDEAERDAPVRLRLINAGGMTSYQVQLYRYNPLSGAESLVEGTLVATDACWTKPQQMDTFWVASAQRLDILVSLGADEIVVVKAAVAGATPLGQSGIILHSTAMGLPPGTFPVTTTEAVGWMEDWETSIAAWVPLSVMPANVTFTIDMTGDNGFESINTRSWRLRPNVDTFAPNPFPLIVNRGQRACIKFTNFNADEHPMHMHGHFFQVVAWNGVAVNGPFRDTVVVPRGECNTVTICFDAVNPQINSEWLLHCHLSFHLSAGMLTSIRYNE